MESVMLSIQPQWVEKILNGEKTIEIRKSFPKQAGTPFKCYIYCTRGGRPLVYGQNNPCSEEKYQQTYGMSVEKANKVFEILNGKVIAEFICNEVDLIECDSEQYKSYIEKSCLTLDDFIQYCKGNLLYAWHISDLVIYDEPKELNEFYKYCGDNPKCGDCDYYHSESNESIGFYEECCSPLECFKELKRPPQSWCYVESEV